MDILFPEVFIVIYYITGFDFEEGANVIEESKKSEFIEADLRRTKVLNKIRNDSYSYTKLSGSAYAIRTSNNKQQILEEIYPLLDEEKDSFFILPLTNAIGGRGESHTINWLKENLNIQ